MVIWSLSTKSFWRERERKMSVRGWEGDDEQRSFAGRRTGGSSVGDGAQRDNDGDTVQDESNTTPQKPATTRRKRNLLTDSHLLSEEGFKKIYTTFPYQTSGSIEPGQEDKALTSLIRMYKQWAYDLYPGLNFEDFIDRAENLGRQQTVQGLMSDLRSKEMRRALGIPEDESFNARDGHGSADDEDEEAQRQQDEAEPEDSGFIVPGGDADDGDGDYSDEEAML